MNSPDKEPTTYRIVFFLLIGLACVYYWYVTGQGLVLTPDSVIYLGVAQSLDLGNGLIVPFGLPPNQPLAQFPPLVSYAIFAISQLGISLMNSGRILNLLLLAAFIFVMERLLIILLGKKRILTLILLIFVIISLINSFLFTTLGSEPLMIVMGLTGFYLLVMSEMKVNKLILLAAGLFLALALTARYAGITYLAASAIVFLFFIHGSWRNKIGKIIILSAPSVLFLTLWFLRDTGSAITATNRQLLIHPIKDSHITWAIATISNWFLIPASYHILVKLIVILVLLLMILLVILKVLTRKQFDSPALLERLVVTFILIYPIFLILSITLVDANIPLDYRLLSPIFVLIPFIVVLFIQFLSKNKLELERPLVIFFISLFAVFSVAMLLQNRVFMRDVHRYGFGFNYSEFRNNPVFEYLRNRGQPANFISNAPEPVFLYTNREVFSFPRRFNAMEDRDNPEFNNQISLLKDEYLQVPAYFIFFEKIPGGNQEDQRFFQKQFGLTPVEKYKDVVVYSYSPGLEP